MSCGLHATLPLPVSSWRQSCLLLEECAESRYIREPHLHGNVLYGPAGGGKQKNGTPRDGLEDKLLNSIPADMLDKRGEIFGRQAQLVGIESHTTLLGVIIRYQPYEPYEDFHVTGSYILAQNQLSAEDGTQMIGQPHEQEIPLVIIKLAAAANGYRGKKTDIGLELLLAI